MVDIRSAAAEIRRQK